MAAVVRLEPRGGLVRLCLADGGFADLPAEAAPPHDGTVHAAVLPADGGPPDPAPGALRALLRGQVVAVDDTGISVSCGGLHSRWPRAKHPEAHAVDSDVQVRLHWR